MSELYRLPSPEEPSFRGYAGRTALLVLYASALGSLGLAQHLAARLADHPLLGSAWLDRLPQDLAAPAHAVAAVLGGLGFLSLAGRRARRLAPFLLPAAAGVEALVHGPLYTPLHLFLWWHRWAALASVGPMLRASVAAWAVGTGVLAFAWAANLLRVAPRFAAADLHGSARWATMAEARRAGLLARPVSGRLAGPGDGLFLGLWPSGRHGRPLYDREPHHLLVFAPTRSGKGVGLVIPNLLSWTSSAVVHDIKGENFALTAGFRQRELGQRVFRFDPTEVAGTASRYNPMLEVRPGDFAVRDAQNLADILVDPDGNRRRDHWDRTAHSLLTGLILHVLFAEREKTLARCAELLSQPGCPVEETLEGILAHPHLGAGPHPVVAAEMRAILDKAPNERSGVLSTALSFLALYRDPVAARNLAASDFRLADLVSGPVPATLYLTVPPSDLSRTRPLMRLLISQMFRALTERLPSRAPGAPVRHPLLLVLDEFPSLGHLPFLADALAYLAGYDIRALLVAQDLAQLHGLYGKDEPILGNCHARVAYAPNKPETAQLLSTMCGDMTVHHERVSTHTGGGRSVSASRGVNPADHRRPLLTPDEVMRLPAEEALVFLAGSRPILARKARYYADRELARRAALPPPATADRLAVASPWPEGAPEVLPGGPSAPAPPLLSRIPRRRRRARPPEPDLFA